MTRFAAVREFDGLPKPFPANHVSARRRCQVRTVRDYGADRRVVQRANLPCRQEQQRRAASADQSNRLRAKMAGCILSNLWQEALYVQLVNHLERGDTGVCRLLSRLANEKSLGCVASNGARYATQAEARLLHVLRCIAHKTTLSKSESIRAVNHERFLTSSARDALDNLRNA